MIQLYLKEQEKRLRADTEYTAKDEAAYRGHVESILGDEVSFKIAYVTPPLSPVCAFSLSLLMVLNINRRKTPNN